MSGTVLILGASGRFGRHAAEAFWNAGWSIRTFDRQQDTLALAARGVDVIVNGWNPAYPDWARDVPVLSARVIEVARATGATVILPGNIYVYGQNMPSLIRADTPQKASNPLGRVRLEMETAFRESGVRTIVLRAGDFIDTEPSGNWFDRVITAKLDRGKLVAPGDPDVPHSWAFLPDLARAAVALADMRDQLHPFHEVLYPGHTLSMRDIAQLLQRIRGEEVRVTRMNWAPLWMSLPFWPMARSLMEMRYLWDTPHALDGAEFHRLLPKFRESDALTAIASAIGHQQIDPDQPMAGRHTGIAAE